MLNKFNLFRWKRKKKEPVPLTPGQKKIYSAMMSAFIYAGTGLFVFIASLIITTKDPYFKSQSPLLSYAVSFAVAAFVVVVEIIRKRMKQKRNRKA